VSPDNKRRLGYDSGLESIVGAPRAEPIKISLQQVYEKIAHEKTKTAENCGVLTSESLSFLPCFASGLLEL
jgi:hypothetical protein